MCIIMTKVKGTDFPSPQIIANCISANRDGFSMAWNEDGKVHNFKTMDPDEALLRYTQLSERLDASVTTFIFHARIATHGTKRLENCHCWIQDGYAFAHNGVMSNIPVHDDLTDSECFFREYFLPVLKGCGAKVAKKVSQQIIGPSRIVCLNGRGDVMMLGHWENDCETGHKGTVYYSNLSYRPVRSVFPRSCGGSYTSYQKALESAGTLTKHGNGRAKRQVKYSDSARERAMAGFPASQTPSQGLLFPSAPEGALSQTSAAAAPNKA